MENGGRCQHLSAAACFNRCDVGFHLFALCVVIHRATGPDAVQRCAHPFGKLADFDVILQFFVDLNRVEQNANQIVVDLRNVDFREKQPLR